jgi:hypothetical protein
MARTKQTARKKQQARQPHDGGEADAGGEQQAQGRKMMLAGRNGQVLVCLCAATQFGTNCYIFSISLPRRKSCKFSVPPYNI